MQVVRIETVPPRPAHPAEKHRCRIDGREALFRGDDKIDVATRDSYEDLVDVRDDGKKLVVASNVRVREITLETLEMRDLLHGPWLVAVKCLADDLVAVLGAEGTHRLQRSDPDVAEMQSVKDMPRHLTWFDVQTPGMLFILDTVQRPEKILAESVALRASSIDAVLGGRVLFVSDEDRTTVYGVKKRKLVLLGRLDEHVGRVFEFGGHVFGDGCEILGLEEAWGNAKVEEKKYEDVAVEGDFTFEPVAAIPPPPNVPRGASAVVGAGGWNASRKFGAHVFALVAHPSGGYECALVDESKTKAKLAKIKPPITGSSFKYDLSFDGTRCVIATTGVVWDVDCNTREAVLVTSGDTFASVTLLDDVIVAIHRDGVDGTLDFWARKKGVGGGHEKVMSIDCGKYDTLFMLHDGNVIGLASEYAVAGSKLRTHFFGAKGTDVRYLGCALAAFKHGTSVRSSSYVEDSEGRTWEIKGLGQSLRKALESPAAAIDLRLSDTERMQDGSSHIGDSEDSL